jgi:hypothetical protein
LYELGRGVAADPHVAAQWYRQAATRGLAAAQYRLGTLLESGIGLARDEPAAALWYRQAAERGDADAQNALGVMLAQGRGGPRDEAAALDWYRKAAAQDHAAAQFNLALLLDRGRDAAQGSDEVLGWLRRAAAQGHAPALNNLGVAYRTGQGVMADLVMALALYELSAQADASMANPAVTNRRQLLAVLDGTEIAQARALAQRMRDPRVGLLAVLERHDALAAASLTAQAGKSGSTARP